MKAVVLRAPHQVVIETRPLPRIEASTDVIIKVELSGLCGSDLHAYRGRANAAFGHVCGHEVFGQVIETGNEVRLLRAGDEVIVPFCTSCGKCTYCMRGQSSRCVEVEVFGTHALPGGQAEYIRCPLADTTCTKAPPGLPRPMLLLMADVFPTGYFAASRYLKPMTNAVRLSSTVAVIGVGPVGLCAIVTALTFVNEVYAIDGVESRLSRATAVGAKPINSTNVSPFESIMTATNGKGVDVVIEAVGNVETLQLAVRLVRTCGSISVIGVPASTPSFGTELYDKNVTMSFGRAPVRSVFDEAFPTLLTAQSKLAFLCSDLRPIEDASQAYEDFEQRKSHKIIFTTGQSD